MGYGIYGQCSRNGGIALYWWDIRQRLPNYLITFKVGPLCIHTQTHKLVQSILPLLAAPAEGFFRNLPESGRRIPFDALYGCATCPLETHFLRREQPKVTRARTGEYGGWVMTVIATQQAMRGSVRYREAETAVPACHFLRTASRNLCKTCT
jgi:hypothetical protein